MRKEGAETIVTLATVVEMNVITLAIPPPKMEGKGRVTGKSALKTVE
jgi:hypothetical protein